MPLFEFAAASLAERIVHGAASGGEIGRGEFFSAVAPHCDDGVHHTMRELAQTAAKRVNELFEASIATGKITLENLFDRKHRQIPDTSPPKYSTRFDAFTDRVMPDIQEPLLRLHANIA
jgi:hypothetical protein